ncbi:hypothetical protein COL940_011047 [Colletotrichum noveboracense]|nr:hypothetical protein COL940_011047 [Colletotrichum noveboracense]
MTPLHIAANLDPKDVESQPGQLIDEGPIFKPAGSDVVGSVHQSGNNLSRAPTAKATEGPMRQHKSNIHQNEVTLAEQDTHSKTEHMKAPKMDAFTPKYEEEYEVIPFPATAKAIKDAQHTRTAFPAFDLLHIIRLLVDANPRVLIHSKDDNDNTPFQSRLYMLAKFYNRDLDGMDPKTREVTRSEIIEGDSSLTYMRSYIINNFDRRDAIQALYKVGDEFWSLTYLGCLRPLLTQTPLAAWRKFFDLKGY